LACVPNPNITCFVNRFSLKAGYHGGILRHNQEGTMASLKDKFRGCIAGSWVGSAMGAVVEGWPREKVVQTYGRLDRLLPYAHYIEFTDWQRDAGTTEDGIERQKLISTAIIEKKDRVLAQDVAAVWRRDLVPEKMTYKQEPYDRSLLELLRSGIPAVELGRLSHFGNVITMARVSHPLGLVNAGDPAGAADDSFEVGKLYMREFDFGLRWAALYNAGIAEACRPGATVASVIETIRRFANYRAETGSLYKGGAEKWAYDTIARDVERAFDLGHRCRSADELREKFEEIFFGGFYLTYGLAQAHEIVSKGLALFALHQGDPRESIISATNFGRDTDCLAAIAGGLCGALSGASTIPREWIEQVNAATKKDPYTNSHLTIEETADGLYEAFLSRQKRLVEYLQLMRTA
jgi:ADP-ribosylglycohydrolase